jgi:3-oxoacyl-[acyl-carrier protein] reductase
MSLYGDKVVVVTGTSRGLGKMIAGHFLANGANVIGLSRSSSDIRHEHYVHQTADVTDTQSVHAAIGGLQQMDVLINNAGQGPSSYALLQDAAEAEASILTNFYGTFLVSREACKIMYKNGGGRIVNIGSILAAIEPVGASIYAATKAAIETFSGVLAKEVAGRGITVNTIGMASIETEMFAALGKKGEEYVKALPISRLAKPDDVYNVLDFFCSPRSSFITGQVLYLGGIR